jgi:hypothetical protein
VESALSYLQNWYVAQCDESWEHHHGVTIDTLDNPGWRVAIDLTDTPRAGASLAREIVQRDDDDWIHVWADGETFNAACGPLNLAEALDRFRSFAEGGHPLTGHSERR